MIRRRIVENKTLEVQNIQKYYISKENTTKAIDGISFDVAEGEFVGIMGSSGSGKSTLLNCISTIDTVTNGKIYIDNEDISKIKGNKLSDFRGKKLGFIFQDFNLLDTLTAYENIALALSINNISPSEIDKRVKQIAKDLNIEEVLNKFPYHMSGGQQQRVAAARAIVTNPALILADEPTGALDSASAIILLEMLSEINTKFNATILMVTHDAMSASYSNRILFLKDGQIFKEIFRGADDQKTFFSKVLEVVSEMGGQK
ncbi:multidrug ABC transporter ATP-binding protein [Candidatus Epulonipiscium fishelsonii]|uniref:Multidrug ABC transporter ATP-binding protein n=1 Tax=Candidatus Epulonipiscium fishelsonii TaxID=77094 RepID=A0ACC8XJ45_9FIRM|nr:multidrug ABC transporter ATP-binding protein [Epulopiscium sp. SCG-D08WGA-EpuloA1]